MLTVQSPQENVPCDLRFQNIVVIDCETKVPVGGPVKWTEYEKMGVSVTCLYDYQDGDNKVYLGELEGLAERLNFANLVVGFNILGFDLPLLRSNGLKIRIDLPVYDMLYESRKALGWDPTKSYDSYPTGLKLDDHLVATFGNRFKKTANGAEAPVMYSEGRIGELVSYCLGDVRRERMLFEMAWKVGGYKTPTHGDLKVADPRILLAEKRAYRVPAES